MAPSVRAVVWDGARGTELRVVDPPAPRPGWVRVDIAFTGICGSDIHLVAGMGGGRPGVTLGHEMVGVLAEASSTLPAGTKVFVNPVIRCGQCDTCREAVVSYCSAPEVLGITLPGGMSDQVMAPQSALFALPDSLDLRLAALLEPVAICMRAVRRSGLQLGQSVHIVGGGPIGALVALLCRHAGAGAVTFSEPAAGRRSMMEGLGFTSAETAMASAHIVFDASGHPSVPPTLASWARPGATIVMLGAYPPGGQPIDLLDVMVRELTVVGTVTYLWADVQAAIALLSEGSFDVQPLITDVVPLVGVGEALDRLRSGDAMKILISPSA